MSIELIKAALKESADVKMKIAEQLPERVLDVVAAFESCIKSGGKAMFCGNGGSAADSQHLATELVVRLTGRFERKALPALALTTDTSILTACSNDYGFDYVFARQIEALGREGDMLFAISTSGKSSNVIRAVETAAQNKILTVGMLGGDGGDLKNIVDHPLIVPSADTMRIQEAHITIGHIIIQLLEKRLFS
jgi:D-sedoheptulose 7-phosphate isomerase